MQVAQSRTPATALAVNDVHRHSAAVCGSFVMLVGYMTYNVFPIIVLVIHDEIYEHNAKLS